jgi:hypothetical protein
MFCMGCGLELALPMSSSYGFVREPDGRAEYNQGGAVVHRCEDGVFVAVGEFAKARMRH